MTGRRQPSGLRGLRRTPRFRIIHAVMFVHFSLVGLRQKFDGAGAVSRESLQQSSFVSSTASALTIPLLYTLAAGLHSDCIQRNQSLKYLTTLRAPVHCHLNGSKLYVRLSSDCCWSPVDRIRYPLSSASIHQSAPIARFGQCFVAARDIRPSQSDLL